MTERTTPPRGTIVRAVDTPRLGAAERAVAAKLDEIREQDSATWPVRLLAALLEADDAHAARRGLITQHHGISRADLTAVLDLAARTADGQHAAPGKIHDDCGECARMFALGRVRNAVEWIAAPARVPAQ